jgi:hypothetical protein
MITVELARRLRAAGLGWEPGPGDRFVFADPKVDLDDVFVVSEMTVDVAETPTGPLIRFNGTTEWALDSLEAAAAVWLPREDQLRELLGRAFVGLESLSGATPGYAVTVEVSGARERHVDVEVEPAYARALLAVLTTRP